jgi:VanZ family protein
MVVIFVESSMSVAPLPGNVSDKVAHAFGYSLLGALIARAAAGGFPRPLASHAAVLSVAMAVLYGASDEFHQRFVPGRSADVADLIADAVGATIAVAAVWACGILWPRLAPRWTPRRDL